MDLASKLIQNIFGKRWRLSDDSDSLAKRRKRNTSLAGTQLEKASIGTSERDDRSTHKTKATVEPAESTKQESFDPGLNGSTHSTSSHARSPSSSQHSPSHMSARSLMHPKSISLDSHTPSLLPPSNGERLTSPSLYPSARLQESDLKRLYTSVVNRPWWIDPGGCIDTGFLNFNHPERQTGFAKCLKDCDCSSLSCPCFANNTSCELSCQCTASICDRRFPSCHCADGCSSHCFCYMVGRECSDSCRCTSCDNQSADRPVPKTRVQPSGIAGAGLGLFAAQDITPGTFVGVYDGSAVQSGGEEYNGVIMDFKISETHCIRAQPELCRPSRINHSAIGPNIKFYIMETRNGRRPVVFAYTSIASGEELLANYGENPEFAKFAPPPSPPSPKFVVTMALNHYTYNVEPENQWHAMRWKALFQVRSTKFRVNQDVLINHSSSPPTELATKKRMDAVSVLRYKMAHCWVGRIMEIRQQCDRDKKVYIAVAWYDLVHQPKKRCSKGLRPPDEGEFELVGLRRIEIVEGATLSCPTKVVHVPEGVHPPKNRLFYRIVQPRDAYDPECTTSIDPAGPEEVFLHAKSTKQPSARQGRNRNRNRNRNHID